MSLGWGSLIWDKEKEFPVESGWAHDGPCLPVEFARQSSDERITLVIAHGSRLVRVFSARLKVDSLSDARSALACREGIRKEFSNRSIGYWSPSEVSSHKESKVIGHWACEKGVDGVVWTALKPRFKGETRMPSVDEVIKHLNGLSGSERRIAKEYICKTPPEVRTDYRLAIERELGWTFK